MTRYFNRELSWIEFNARVLHEACRKDIPLLERLNFLAITSSNFDEFFRVRVASIKRREKTSPHETDASGLTPSALLKKISVRCHQLEKTASEVLTSDILPSLAKNGICFVRNDSYSITQKSFTESYFRRQVFPLLTPLRTDGNEFPHIGNLQLHAAFLLEPTQGIKTKAGPLAAKEGTKLLALVPLPSGINRVIYLPGNENKKQFTTLDDIISLYGTELFPGYSVKETMMFKVCRDADFSVDEDSGSNFIQAMEEVLVQRQSSFPVRLVCDSRSQTILSILQEKLDLKNEDIYIEEGLIDPSSIMDITSLEEAQELLYPQWNHFENPMLPEEGSYWNTIRQHDVLFHVPYESYDPIVKFIQDAASDENVLAIKMTLYRTGNNSPIVKALEEAAQRGKSVTAFVELKARFDEKQNISWAAQLEKAGVIVVYGVVNLKVHAKAALVVRMESDGLRRYVHLSTGNYNPKTAKIYQDLSILTANHEIANDATLFFNAISGYSALQTMHQLYMAPLSLKSKLIELIDREIKLSTPEEPGLIIAKMNSLCHKEIIDKLYEASSKGVKIMLNVRGICTLVPGLPLLSENIHVVSIIDRYLEHSRIFYFQNGGSPEIYLSSADWMERNLDRRIELMFPVTDPEVFKNIEEILNVYFQDNTHAHVLLKDGSWKALEPGKKELPVRAQEVLYKKAKKRYDSKKSQPHAEFIVRRR